MVDEKILECSGFCPGLCWPKRNGKRQVTPEDTSVAGCWLSSVALMVFAGEMVRRVWLPWLGTRRRALEFPGQREKQAHQ